MPIYTSVVTRAIDLPIHLHIFQEHAFNDSIQCSEDYPLMYEGDSHRWYLKLSYLDRMPNSNIPHQTTVMMMRIYRIFFIERLSTHMEQAGPYRLRPSSLVQRNRGWEGGLHHYFMASIWMKSDTFFPTYRWTELRVYPDCSIWRSCIHEHICEKKIICKENVVAHRKSFPAC